MMKMQRPFRDSHRGAGQRGYILLTLMLFVALLAIAAVAIAPTLTFQIRRDREEELVHRGVQYSRAVRKYFKKFGRYPTRIEDLENTNNMRFLRRRYKDPITGNDFKLLHFGEVQMTMGGGIAGAMPATAMAGAPTAGAGPAGASATGAQSFSLGPAAASAPAGQPQSGSGAAPPDANANTNSASSPSQATAAGGNQLSSQVFGGGPIVGVVSASKAESIREFNNKNHYNQWQFIYDPGSDRGGLLNTPAQPPLQNAVANGQPGAPGAAPAPGAMGTGFGSSTGSFGSSMGTGMSNGPMGSQPPAQNPPSAQPQR
jgi:type II secretory pathway pseudopilin PulG